MKNKLRNKLGIVLSVVGILLMFFFLYDASSPIPILANSAPYFLTLILSFYISNSNLTGGVIAMLVIDFFMIIPVAFGYSWEYTMLFSLLSMGKLLLAFPVGILLVNIYKRLNILMNKTKKADNKVIKH